MSMLKTFSMALGLSLYLLVGAPGLACSGSEGSGTTGRRVTLRTVVAAEDAARTPFTNPLGWTVRLERASVSIGALHYFDGDPIVSRRAPPPVLDALGPRRAWAHPGHYLAGTARGEMLGRGEVDLLADTNLLPLGDGISGPVRSARLRLAAAPSAPAADEGPPPVVYVEGEATKSATSLKFVAKVGISELFDASTEPTVEGCPFEEADIDADGTVTMTIRPTVWFEQVDFSEVSPRLDGQPTDIVGTTAFRGFTRGLKKGSAYRFRYQRD